jgi:hypothetical protein
MGIRPHFVEHLEELTAGANGPAAILEKRRRMAKFVSIMNMSYAPSVTRWLKSCSIQGAERETNNMAKSKI